MSNPTRYSLPNTTSTKLHYLKEHPQGNFVSWDDYEVLDVENKRLTKEFNGLLEKHMFNKTLNHSLASENERLKVEVKRLTTALKTADRVIKPLRDAAAKKSNSQ